MGKRVLVVEDDEFIGEVIAASLIPHGYEVDVIADGSDAWQYLEHHRPSLILLDLSLPNEDGLTVCRKLRSSPLTASIPVIVVSALCQARTVQAVMEAGANDFIRKPFDIDDLVSAARTHARRGRPSQKSPSPRFVPHTPAARPA